MEELGGEDSVAYFQEQAIQHIITAPRTAAAGESPERIHGTIHLARESEKMSFNSSPRSPWEISAKIGSFSTAGVGQVKAFQPIKKNLIIHTSKPGRAKIAGIGKGKGVYESIGPVIIDTPIGKITFYVAPCNIPFLLGLRGMRRLRAYANIVDNTMIQDGKPVVTLIENYGHLGLTLGEIQTLFTDNDDGTIGCFLTEQEIRTIHRRWGHPSVTRMYKVLQRANHTDKDTFGVIQQITKFCRDCQLNSNRPLRYRFSLHSIGDFNHTIYFDIVYTEDGPVIHIVDAATGFGAGEFLSAGEKAADCWNAILRCWISTYIGPPENLVHDAGKNFGSAAFRAYAFGTKVQVPEVPIEAHNSVGKCERYHKPLKRASSIFRKQFAGQGIDKQACLKMAIKAPNDTSDPDGIVPTLCVFGTYPRITWNDPPVPNAIERAETTYRAMIELRKFLATRLVQDARNIRNGPKNEHLEQVPIGGQVKVLREGGKSKKAEWTGPYELVDKDKETITVRINDEDKIFRSTAVGKWFEPNDDRNAFQPACNGQTEEPIALPQVTQPQAQQTLPSLPYDQISQNEIQAHPTSPILNSDPQSKSQSRYPKRHTRATAEKAAVQAQDIFLAPQEEAIRLFLELRSKGMILTPGEPFEMSTKEEIEGLLAKGVFEFLRYNDSMFGKRIFKSCIVSAVKGSTTLQPREK
ncbi:hypothetical protein K3495_g5165 [Podosphaera aphanis]|nr:hypothetical protein K3495_g5165 [Podosphaera aphanis]